jgi:hypothetical protein
MKSAIEMASCGMICVPCFMEIGIINGRNMKCAVEIDADI